MCSLSVVSLTLDLFYAPDETMARMRPDDAWISQERATTVAAELRLLLNYNE
jgi:hypothetical protein